jgi:hypothetical protein
VIESTGHAPYTLSDAELAALPPTEVLASFIGEHGQERAKYRGALVWSVLERAGAVDPNTPRPHVRQIVTATGQDGYTAVLALAEIDPAFEGKTVILAFEREGASLGAGHARLIVLGDQRGGRSVRDVVRLAVQ